MGVIGRYIYEKLRMNKTTVMFPMPDKNGNVTYLGENYSVQEVEV